MGFVRTKEELDRYYGLGARQFIGAKMMGIMFETREDISQRIIPPPLEQPDSPGGMIFIAEYPKTNLGIGYREAALFLRCKYQGEAGNYCLSMPIDSEESRLYNGRDIFGYPKKAADICIEEKGDEVHGWVERHGIRFIDLKVKLAGSLPELPPQAPNFLFKAHPRIDLEPGFDGPVLLCRQQTTVDMQSMKIGPAELDIRESYYDPWAEIEMTNILTGFYMVTNNTMQPGKVLTEVDADAYLPYYFKITDFFDGTHLNNEQQIRPCND